MLKKGYAIIYREEGQTTLAEGQLITIETHLQKVAARIERTEKK